MNESDPGCLAVVRRWCWVAFALLVASPLAAQPIDLVVNGEALVRLVETADIATFNGRYQTTTLREIPSRKIYLVALDPGADPDQFKAAADADPDTVWVELNYYGQVPEARGRCFYFADNPDAAPYLDQPAWGQIGLGAAHQQTTGLGTTVAVVDSGIDATHIALLGIVLDTGWNFVDDTSDTADVGNGMDDDGDGEIDEMTGHGTHVAGILGLVAPDAMLLPVKVLDSDGNSDNFILAAGIFYAIDQGVSVISISVGSTYNSEAVRDAVLEAQSRGIVVTAAGGNVDTRLPEEYPALNTGVIGVASVDESDIKGYFSNYHEGFVVSAPGVAIVSTLPGDLYAAWDGTSMSTPMVAGAAALLLSRHPEWPADESRSNNVRIALVQSADDVDALNPMYAGMLGAGRLNAAAAMSHTDAYQAAVAYPVGSAPEAVTTADFDGDGLRDLAVANRLSGSVSVLLHETVKTFGTAAEYAAGAGPIDVAHGDFDADGSEDLVIVNEDSGSVTILFNGGNGVFGDRTDHPVGAGPSAVAVGDLDSDEDLDLAIARDNLNSVLVLINDGAGAFSTGGTYAVGARPLDIAIAELTGDAHPDLVTVNRDANRISVLRSLGSGSFAPAVHYLVGLDPRALTAADFDGDGDTDVATANHDSRDITIAWNDGSGSFNTRSTLGFSDGRQPAKLAAGDIDCDGDVELLVTNGDAGLNAVAVFLGRGDGSFLQPVNYAVGADPQGIVADDVDGDLDADLAIVSSGANTISVLLNQTSAHCGGGLFGDLDGDCEVGLGDLAQLLATYGATQGAVYVDGDLDKDGDVDLADLASLLAVYGSVCE